MKKKDEKMHIILNGEHKEFESTITVNELLSSLNLVPDTVVVELNSEILQPESYTATKLADNDQVEIIRFVGGG